VNYIQVEPRVRGLADYDMRENAFIAVFELDHELRQRGQSSKWIGHKAQREDLPEDLVSPRVMCQTCGHAYQDFEPFIRWAWAKIGSVDAFVERKPGEEVKLI